MPTFTEYSGTGRQPFVADRDSLDFDTGHSINWANVASDGTYGVTGKRVIPAGTRMGELINGDGRISPRVVTTNPATGILATDAVENSETDALSGYGLIKGGVLYDNLLPGATGTPATIPAAEKTELQDSGTGYSFVQYVDSSAV